MFIYTVNSKKERKENVQPNGEINKRLPTLHLNLLIVKSPHNLFHNWVRDHDNVVTNQLAQEYKGNTSVFTATLLLVRITTTLKTMNPVRALESLKD